MRCLGVAAGQEQPAVVEEHDAVAQHAPALFGVAGDDVGRRAVGIARGRASGFVAMPDISIQLAPFLADGELVAYRGLGQGTHTGAELFGIPAAGKHTTFTETHIIRLREAKVCEHWLQVDLLGLLSQLRS